MSNKRLPAPGNPTPGMLANADQQHAAVRSVLADLVGQAATDIIGAGLDPDDVGVWIKVSMDGCLEAGLNLSDDHEGLVSALAALAGEAVLQLAVAQKAETTR